MPKNCLKPGSSARAATDLPLVLFAALLAAFAGLTGCSSSKPASRTTPSQTERPQSGKPQPETRSTPVAIAQNEDFDPMTLKAPAFRIARKQVQRKSDTLAVRPSSSTQVDTSWQTVAGYQVQLLQTEDAKLARSTVREAILALNVDVETIYEAPYYKIRAGRFFNRYDAEQLQNLATEKGYANCWVVRTQVKVRANELLNPK
ncbi:MAG: SPOR domain-containing protein [candidate division KSB1 bacterium]|nr:SPOR domain-containing protein [candidate division KSB1 bacterium]MDZ7366619.1 SPOR domain-containing protein [candidate division KSB1 bacterium]MDZ7404630.1 SPOR domain-containing protein [candidate division KSB1 bacterium]